mmetsp:Transcript_59880/g.129821  ORF Transcript_59880/g.129821 Transcript_59880/m.129821 type:complete len:235 (-) Transcript_59880:133-837(-)
MPAMFSGQEKGRMALTAAPPPPPGPPALAATAIRTDFLSRRVRTPCFQPFASQLLSPYRESSAGIGLWVQGLLPCPFSSPRLQQKSSCRCLAALRPEASAKIHPEAQAKSTGWATARARGSLEIGRGSAVAQAPTVGTPCNPDSCSGCCDHRWQSRRNPRRSPCSQGSSSGCCDHPGRTTRRPGSVSPWSRLDMHTRSSLRLRSRSCPPAVSRVSRASKTERPNHACGRANSAK